MENKRKERHFTLEAVNVSSADGQQGIVLVLTNEHTKQITTQIAPAR